MIEIESNPRTVSWGRLPTAATTPVTSVESGEIVVIDTVSHEGILADQGRDPVGFFGQFGIKACEVLSDAIEIAASDIVRDEAHDGPHIVTGPIAVNGARPGDLLRVEVLELSRRVDYGIVSNRHGRGVLAGELPRADDFGHDVAVVSTFGRVIDDSVAELIEGSQRIRFSLREFLGLMGVVPDVDVAPSSTPPGSFGGNLDVRHLGVGSTLVLPVAVDEALFYAGDPHFAQGNGEVALTAFEAPLRATLRLTVDRSDSARRIAHLIGHPYGETDHSLIAIGIGESLDDAMRAAVRHALLIVHERTGLSESLALSYLSAAADFEVSQAVNGVRGVHWVIKKNDLESVQIG